MPVSECVVRVSYPEFKSWQLRFREDWNKPSRTDHYLMLIAHRILYVLGGQQKGTSITAQKIPFTFSSGKKAKPISKERATQLAKARWFGMLGIGRKK